MVILITLSIIFISVFWCEKVISKVLSFPQTVFPSVSSPPPSPFSSVYSCSQFSCWKFSYSLGFPHLLCFLGWPWTAHPSATTFLVLDWQACATTLSLESAEDQTLGSLDTSQICQLNYMLSYSFTFKGHLWLYKETPIQSLLLPVPIVQAYHAHLLLQSSHYHFFSGAQWKHRLRKWFSFHQRRDHYCWWFICSLYPEFIVQQRCQFN